MATPAGSPVPVNPDEVPGSSDAEDVTRPAYPPYPPFTREPAPPSVADTIVRGRDLRIQHKSMPKREVRPLPRPAKPRGPKVSNVKLSKRALRAHARCLRRHGAVLTDRLELMAKPPKRSIIGLWRDHAHKLSPETIARLRCMLDADEPFKPDQAYEYFINMRKAKKRNAAIRVNKIKKDVQAMCGDKRFVWARDATVAFARGIQQRLARPGYYVLADGMLRLSNIIMHEICGYMHMRPPPRCCLHPKAKFIMEISDKVAVWIDEILSDSEERMLLMDYDEDEEILNTDRPDDMKFDDDFLNMMGGNGGVDSEYEGKSSRRAYENFTGVQKDAFDILTNTMDRKGDEQLIAHASSTQTYKEGSTILKAAETYDAPMYSPLLANKIMEQLSESVKAQTPSNLETVMKEVVDISAKYLAQILEHGESENKKPSAAHQKLTGDKLEAFNILTNSMERKGAEPLLSHGSISQSYKEGASDLRKAESFSAPRYNFMLAEQLNKDLTELAIPNTPSYLQSPMKDVVNMASKYLARNTEEVDGGRGSKGAPACEKFTGDKLDAFKILTETMTKKGDEQLLSHDEFTQSYKHAADELKTAKTLDAPNHNKSLAHQIKIDLARAAKSTTPDKLGRAMSEIVDISSKYLAQQAERISRGKGAISSGKSSADIKANLSASGLSIERSGVNASASGAIGARGGVARAIGFGKSGADIKANLSGSGLPAARSGVNATASGAIGAHSSGVESSGVSAKTSETNRSGAGTNIDTTSGVSGVEVSKHGTGSSAGQKGASERSVGLGSISSDDEAGLNRRVEDKSRTGADASGMRRNETDRSILENEKRRSGEVDRERESAMQILHKQLRDRGGETFYKQPQTELTHAQGSEWLIKSPTKVDSTVKNSGDTARLHKKFERRISSLVSKATPPQMADVMQDVVIESSRILSEIFVAQNYQTLAREALIAEMQKRGNELLIELDGAAESYFFAAQRLKKAKSLEVTEPCHQVVYYLRKKLEEVIRCRAIPRKVSGTMKEYIKEVAEYLSDRVTKPDEHIEAYVTLLEEMEAAGDNLLIEGVIPKSYKESAAFLRQLTSAEDRFRRGDSSLQATTRGRLKTLLAGTATHGYSAAAMDGVIDDATKLLVSYIMLQAEKTEALKVVIDHMTRNGDSVLLRHGNVKKTFADGADLLEGKNTDQLRVTDADPVAARKIQIKLDNLMRENTPAKYAALIDEVIEDATMYLAVYFFKPRVVKICKCKKSVFVQCELWCDEILRRVARPCCHCQRHLPAGAVSSSERYLSAGTSRAFGPADVLVTPCTSRSGEESVPCQAAKPLCKDVCMYLFENRSRDRDRPSGSQLRPSASGTPASFSPVRTFLFDNRQSEHLLIERKTTRTNTEAANTEKSWSLHTRGTSANSASPERRPSVPLHLENETGPKNPSAPTFHENESGPNTSPYSQKHTTMFAQVYNDVDGVVPGVSAPVSGCTDHTSSPSQSISTRRMSDWHAMMVSLVWNVRAWRAWIQEIFDRAHADVDRGSESDKGMEEWKEFRIGVSTEALQWRQYKLFSRNLVLRLALRYRDKQIVSPTRATVKTQEYMACQQEMLDIIDRFNSWTQWLSAVVKEAESLQAQHGSGMPLHEIKWRHVKRKLEERSVDWLNYNVHLRTGWENSYSNLVADWLPAWNQPGPVWVASACGAVPSGAVAAGVFEGEVIWVSRSTHGGRVLPAALRPSKHCCMLYSEGEVHSYSKYQVLCNADVSWGSCRAGSKPARALPVVPGTFAGRVLYRGSHLLGAVLPPHYRCHVVIFGRPFAFNCYEVLIVNDDA